MVHHDDGNAAVLMQRMLTMMMERIGNPAVPDDLAVSAEPDVSLYPDRQYVYSKQFGCVYDPVGLSRPGLQRALNPFGQ